MSKVLIAGGGAAGMFAAIAAAGIGHEVHVYEKNEKLGKKIYITGKGRCNLTNACDLETLFESVKHNSRFLYSSFYGYTNQDVMSFFETEGMPVKVERGNRVFPVSDRASDVIRTLADKMAELGVQVHLNNPIQEIRTEEGCFRAVKVKKGGWIGADALIVASGGLSYPTTGSTGDGYAFAKKLGHTVTPLAPVLVPFRLKDDFVPELQGLSLKNVTASLRLDGKDVFADQGELMFTHFGITGPLILSASSAYREEAGTKVLSIDLKPALSPEQLDARLLREFERNQNKQFKNVVSVLFPARLTPVMIRLSKISGDKKIHEVTKQERLNFGRLIKDFQLHIAGLRGYNEAVVTRGGIDVTEVNPKTMESKLVQGLYFAGEVLDLDAVTGGFNLQIAWSTGYAAGSGIPYV